MAGDQALGERETAVVTLLFCDLVRSTELFASMGDDAADDVRRSLLSALEQEAHEHRGTVVKSMGDGVMAVFRTSAADAAACAVAMQRATATLERNGAPAGLELRIGISSGEASHEGGDWFGSPVVEAARLEAAARPGQILASEVVRSIVGTRGNVQFSPAGTRELKGLARPVPVVEVLWKDGAAPPPTGPRWRLRVAGAGLAVVAAAAIAVAIFGPRPSGRSVSTATGLPLVAEGYTPRLEQTDCPPGSDPALRCQDLIVPEDRSKPSGRQLRLPVTVLPSNATRPTIPLVCLGGCSTLPGEIGDTATMAIRGTSPGEALTCPEFPLARREALAFPWTSPAANKLILDAWGQCGQRLVSEGVNLNAYGTDDTVDDLRDLVIAKGWHRINLEGYDEWSRAAVLFAARYPYLVNAVVLGVPWPLGQGTIGQDIDAAYSAVEALVAACQADASCHAAFPDLEARADAIYGSLQRNPIVATTKDQLGGEVRILVSGDTASHALWYALSSQQSWPSIPAVVASDPNTVASAVADGYAAAGVLQAADSGTGAGEWISRYCKDDDQYVSRAALAAAAAAHPVLSHLAHSPTLDVCARWPTNARSVALQPLRPASIDVPALIFGGAVDPSSPAEYAERAAKPFKHATIAVFPTLTGDLASAGPPCIAELRSAFLQDPQATLDVEGCKAQVPPVKFTGTERFGSTSPTPAASSP